MKSLKMKAIFKMFPMDQRVKKKENAEQQIQ